MEMIIFRVNGQPYGMKIDFLEGIEELTKVIPVANAPANIVGIVNIRGEVVPVFDLAKKFGHASGSATHTYLMVRLNGDPICLQVDSVDGMCQIEAGDTYKVPQIVVSENVEYYSNIVKTESGELAIVIMPDKLVDTKTQQTISEFVSNV